MKSIWIWTRSKIKVNKLRSSLLQMEHLHIASVYKLYSNCQPLQSPRTSPAPKTIWKHAREKYLKLIHNISYDIIRGRNAHETYFKESSKQLQNNLKTRVNIYL